MLWSIQNPDGKQCGPLGTKELIAALREGTVSAQAWVRRPGDPGWRPLVSFDAFADLREPDETAELPPAATRLRFAVACGSVLFAFLVGMTAF